MRTTGGFVLHHLHYELCIGNGLRGVGNCQVVSCEVYDVLYIFLFVSWPERSIICLTFWCGQCWDVACMHTHSSGIQYVCEKYRHPHRHWALLRSITCLCMMIDEDMDVEVQLCAIWMCTDTLAHPPPHRHWDCVAFNYMFVFVDWCRYGIGGTIVRDLNVYRHASPHPHRHWALLRSMMTIVRLPFCEMYRHASTPTSTPTLGFVAFNDRFVCDDWWGYGCGGTLGRDLNVE